MEDKKRQYYENFVKNNQEKIGTVFTCDVCEGKFKYFNKYHHNRTARHRNALKFKEKYDKIVSDMKENEYKSYI